MIDWSARTYIKLPGGFQYRVKVFDQAVGIERQQPTRSDSVLYPHAQVGNVWDDSTFDTEALAVLIERYEGDQQRIPAEGEA